MIGIDIEKIERIKDDKMLDKIAVQSEIDYINKFKNRKEKIATLWAVKEATFKALNTSAGSLSYKEIELHHSESGRPYLVLSGSAKELLKGKSIDISISHTEDTACAVVLII